MQTTEIHKLKHLMVRSHIQADFRFQKKRKQTSDFRRRGTPILLLSGSSYWSCQYWVKPPRYEEKMRDQAANWKFIWWIFDTGGNLQNSRLSTLQDGEKLKQDRSMGPIGQPAMGSTHLSRPSYLGPAHLFSCYNLFRVVLCYLMVYVLNSWTF